MPGEGDALQSCGMHGQGFVEIPSHTQAEKTVGVLLLHLGEIGILVAVDEFLHHHGCTDLGIVHV